VPEGLVPEGLIAKASAAAAGMRQEGNRSSTVLGSHPWTAGSGLNFWDRRTGSAGACSGGSKCNRAARDCPERPKASETIVDRAQKQKLVDSLHDVLSKTELVVVTQQVGMTVAEVTNLRRQMRDGGASFKVTKNRLARRALEGTKFARLAPLFKGPTAVAYSTDPVAAAKVAVNYAKANEKLTIVGGAMGDTLLDSSGVKALATLPSLNELRGKLVGLLQTPATRLAVVLQAPAGQLARVVGAYANKAGAEA